MTVENQTDEQKEFSLANLNKEINNCSLCELRKTCKAPVLGEGEQKAIIMYIGEAPGEVEDIQGRPFVGTSGMLFRNAINARQKLPGYSTYITNAVRCRPPNNRTPTNTETQACRVWTTKLLNGIKPKVIVTLGDVAYNAIAEIFQIKIKEKITKLAGYPIYVPKSGFYVFPLLHPAYILRNRKTMLPNFFEQLFFLERSIPGWLKRDL